MEHRSGEVHIADLNSDIRVRVKRGEITLLLPQDAQYAVDARTDLGAVNSDFAGVNKRRKWLLGHEFLPSGQAPHKLALRVGFGDIIIFRQPIPPAQAPTSR